MKKRMRIWTRTKRTTTGSSLVLTLFLSGLAVPLVAEKKEARAPEPAAIIGGSVYRPPGLSLAGAEVLIQPTRTKTPDGRKWKPVRIVTDRRGEFFARVPAVPMSWTVRVRSSGYTEQSRQVSVEGEQSVILSLVLEPEVKGDRK